MTLVKLEPKDYITDVPRYPDFPHAEWKRRINRAKELMSANEIDALVVWKRENVRYFFGFQTTHWEIPSIQPAVGIIPVDGEPLLMVPDLLLFNAQGFCWTRNIRYQPRAHRVDKERAVPEEVATIVKEIGCGQKNIALEMGHLGCMWIPRPLNDIEAFKAALPDARFVDGDKVIWGCRMIKSPLEVDRIRQSCTVLAKCHSAVVEKYRPGMSEMDIGKIILSVQVEEGEFHGGDTTICHHIVCNLEKEGINDSLPLSDVMITRNDYILVDLQNKHRGYWADIARRFEVGPMTDEVKRGYELCAEGLDSGVGMIRPGVKVNEVWKAAMKPLELAGLKPGGMAGHGIGMDVHEPPSLDPTNEMLLQEGMVFALEVWAVPTGLKRKGGDGVFGFEDQYVVTDKGYERIEGLNKRIVQVSHPIC